MARQRNRKAEEERRNARARELGFRNRAHMRREMAAGNFVPARAGNKRNSSIVGRAQGPTFPVFAQAGFTTDSQYRRARREAAAWSKAHSHVPQSRYSSKFNAKELRAYYDAFVNPQTKANRIENGLDSLRHWLVDIEHYYTPDEFDERYNAALS